MTSIPTPAFHGAPDPTNLYHSSLIDSKIELTYLLLYLSLYGPNVHMLKLKFKMHFFVLIPNYRKIVDLQ